MNVYRYLSDIELTERLKEADKAALEEVYLRYWPLLYTHALKMIKDHSQAADIVQDIFTSLLINADNLHFKTPLDAYLYRAVKNRIIDNFHKSKHQQKYIDSLRHFISQGDNKTDDMVMEQEMKRRIENAVAGLPPKMREIFEMSRIGNLSRREIAVATNVGEGTVKTQMTRAMKILRTKLSFWLW